MLSWEDGLSFVKGEQSKSASKPAVDLLEDSVKDWVNNELGELNKVQNLAVPRIINKQSTLVMAPTGAGKTLAAFLGIISELRILEKQEMLADTIHALYVSPLKALNNDIHKNLEIPLQAIRQQSGTSIRIAKRTGDTSQQERQRLLRKPPHILITTPESLALMLVAPKFKLHLREIKWLIVDEIHSLADNKRGSLLSLCIARLQYYLKYQITRIGLSATIEPIENIANFLRGTPDHDLGIIDLGGMRSLEIDIISPVRNLVRAPFSIIEKAHVQSLQDFSDSNRTTLVFSNTRHMAERMVYALRDEYPENEATNIAVHHGSLDREVRLDVEQRLKEGKMKTVFTSTSLEMGIDIGSIDLTIQLGSPKTVRALLQRIGRSGHSQELISRGKILVYNRDDLIECVAISKLTGTGDVDAIRIPQAPSDVLFQMLIGMALEKKWDFQEAYDVVVSAYPYRNLTYKAFLEILGYAADPIAGEDSWKYGHLWMDNEIQEFGKRKSARQSYLQNIGTIPEVAAIDVVLQGFRTVIGQVSEKFAEYLQDNDIFVIGGRSYQYIRSIGNKILVGEAAGMVPTVPMWTGEAMSRSWEVSQELDRLFGHVLRLLDTSKTAAVEWVLAEYPVGKREAETVVDYIMEQQTLAPVPRLDTVVIEDYKDPSGYQNVLILSIFGLETNRALGQALANYLSEKLTANIAMTYMDNGVLLKVPPDYHIALSAVKDGLRNLSVADRIIQGLRHTDLFKLRFRHAAARSLMILRRWGKRSISVSQQKRSANWLLKQISEDMPVYQETIREILYDSFDVVRATQVVQNIQNGTIQIEVLPPADFPSAMTHSILLKGELDIAMIDDRRSLLLSLHQQVLSRLLPELEGVTSILDPEVVGEYFDQKIERHRTEPALLSMLEFPKLGTSTIEYLSSYLRQDIQKVKDLVGKIDEVVLLPTGEYTTITLLPYYGAIQGDHFWTGYNLIDPLYQNAFEISVELSPEQGWEELLLRYLKYQGPTVIEEICSDLGIQLSKVRPLLRKMQRAGQVLRGNFISKQSEFILTEDRDNIIRASGDFQEITDEQLRDYRLSKMRLSSSLQSSTIGIEDYLTENGPARDPTEILARLPNFTWKELRRLLLNDNIRFGRFLGRRLVFVHSDHVQDLMMITRTDTPLEGLSLEVLQILSERPGLSQKELVRITGYTSSEIGEALSRLEYELYISRTGYELSLSHGGFPDPKYVALPALPENYDRENITIKLLEQCARWYGPLTLNDFQRITRIPYPSIESGIDQSELLTKRLLNNIYHGFEDQFDEISSIDLGDEDENIYLLNALDPYFYMTSGYFRYNSIPRQMRLTIFYEKMPQGYIEISLPDQNILQVLNIQINKKKINNQVFIEKLGSAIVRLANNAYHCHAVYIEEILYKPVNHRDNSLIVKFLQHSGYHFQIDHLIAGTGQQQEYTINDIFEVRQLQDLQDSTSEITYADLLEEDNQIELLKISNLLNTKDSQEKLQISHYLRKSIMHIHGDYLYSHNLFTALFGKPHHLLEQVDFIDKPMVLRQIANQTEMSIAEASIRVNQWLKDGLIEVVSPYARVPEYRAVPEQKLVLYDRMYRLSSYYIQQFGPMSFGEISDNINKHAKTSRMQLLIVLTDLLKQKRIESVSVRDPVSGSKRLMYLSKSHVNFLVNPARDLGLPNWRIQSLSMGMFKELETSDTHLLTKRGKPVVSFTYKRNIDVGVIDELNFMENGGISIEDLGDVITQIEEFVASTGIPTLQFRKIQGVEPQYWLNQG